MIIRNTTNIGRWLYYTIQGIKKKTFINAFTSLEIPDITDESQINYNPHDEVLKKRLKNIGNSKQTTIKVINNEVLILYNIIYIYYKTLTNGLSLGNLEENHIKDYNIDNFGKINDIVKGQGNDYYTATSNGLGLIQNDKNKGILFNSSNSTMPTNDIKKIIISGTTSTNKINPNLNQQPLDALIMSYNEGIIIYSGTSAMTIYNIQNSTLSGNIKEISMFNNNSIGIITDFDTLHIYTGSSAMTSYNYNNSNLPHANITTIKGNDGKLYIGGNGYFAIYSGTSAMTIFDNSNSNFPNGERIASIGGFKKEAILDAFGSPIRDYTTMWLGTNSGKLIKFSGDTNFTVHSIANRKINQINDINSEVKNQNSNRVLLLATQGNGFYCFNINNLTTENYTTSNSNLQDNRLIKSLNYADPNTPVKKVVIGGSGGTGEKL